MSQTEAHTGDVRPPQQRRLSSDPGPRWVHSVNTRLAQLSAESAVSREQLLDRGRLRHGLQQALARYEDCVRTSADLAGGAPAVLIAHRQSWFVAKLEATLARSGVAVTAACDNGADALGLLIATQPAVLIAEQRLALIDGEELAEQARQYAPSTAVALHSREATTIRTGPDRTPRILAGHLPPEELAGQVAQLVLG